MTHTPKPRRTREQLRFHDDADECVRNNMGLIYSTIRRSCPWLAEALFTVGSQLREDLVAIGMVSIAKAHRDYDETKGKFSTLATRYILNDVLKAEKARKQKRRRVIIVEIDDNRDAREMTPDVAAETWETIRRGSTVSLFEDDCHGETVCETD